MCKLAKHILTTSTCKESYASLRSSASSATFLPLIKLRISWLGTKDRFRGREEKELSLVEGQVVKLERLCTCDLIRQIVNLQTNSDQHAYPTIYHALFVPLRSNKCTAVSRYSSRLLALGWRKQNSKKSSHKISRVKNQKSLCSKMIF